MNNKINLLASLAEELGLTPKDIHTAADVLHNRIVKETELQKKLSREFDSLNKVIDAAPNCTFVRQKNDKPNDKNDKLNNKDDKLNDDLFHFYCAFLRL